MLPQAIEIKAKSVIAQIENGTFCEDDIELLLIRLREYSSPKSIFREISHFIAHHKRDSGLTFLSLYQLYCRMRAYNEFQYLKKSLDLSATFEKWFYDFVLFQLDEIDSQKLKKKYGFSRKRAKQIFKSSFDEAKDGYTCKSAPDHELVNIVNEASSFIKVKPLFNNSEIISSFVETLLALNLISTSEKIEAHSDEIIVCLLLLMQKRNFYIGSDVFGSTDVDFPNDNFGKLKPLELRGKIQVPDGPTIVATLIETGLKFEDWCEPDLLVPKETNIKGHFWTVFDDSAILTVGVKDGYFKLRRL